MNGDLFSPALDIGELDRAGRIKRIITFHLELPAPPSHWPRRLVHQAVSTAAEAAEQTP